MNAVNGSGLGASNRFLLSALPGYFFEYAPSSIVNSSGNIAAWNDLGPHANPMVSSGAQRGIYVANALSGFPGVQGIESAPTHMQSSSSFAFNSRQATVYLVAKFSSTGLGMLYEHTAQADADNGFWLYGEGNGGNPPRAGIALSAAAQNYGAAESVYQVIACQFDRAAPLSAGSMYWGRSRFGWCFPTSTAGNFATDVLNLFNRQDLSFPSSATIVHCIGYNAAHSYTQIQQTIDHLSAIYGLNTIGPQRALYVDGDSISSDTEMLPFSARIVLNGSFNTTTLCSCAYGGKTMSVGAANRVAQIAQVRSGVIKDAIVFLGSNDFAVSATVPSTLFNGSLVPYIQYMQSQGFRNIGIMTMLPRGGSFGGGITPSSFEAAREGAGGWNPLIRANAGTHGYTVLDVGADSTMGTPTAYTNPTYYQSDLVHPTNAGESILYTYAASALTAWA